MRGMREIGWVSVLLVVVGCGGSTGPAAGALVGTWQVTKMEYVSTTGLGTVDLIAQGGAATFVLKADSTYQFTITPSGGVADVSTGTWSGSLDVLTVRETGMTGERQFDMMLSGSTLTLTGANDEFDFNNDGIDEPAKLNVTLSH